MNSKNIVPIVTTCLEVSFEHDHYLGVRAGPAGSAELGFMRPDADAPDTFSGKGITFGIRVADADRECERLRAAGARIVREPADMPWGARAFVTVDPNGVALYVSHASPASPEFAACVR